MQTLNASDAKREFGELLLKAQQEPIAINRNGKPVAVMLSASEYEAVKRLKFQITKAEVEKGLKSIEEGKLIDGETVFANLRKKLEADE